LSKSLAKLTGREERVTRWKDLLFHLPVSFIDRRYSPKLGQAMDGEIITIEVTVLSHMPPRGGVSSSRPYKVMCSAPGGELALIFFHARPDYLQRTLLPVGEKRIVSGRFERNSYGWQMTHPDAIVPLEEIDSVKTVEPLYPLTAGLTNRQLRKLIEQVLAKLPDLPEWQEANWMKSKSWPAWQACWPKLHHPQSGDDLSMENPARLRVAYDEILANQLALGLVRKRLKRPMGQSIKAAGTLRERALKLLSYTLTNAQTQALQEIDADLTGGQRMLRLLQGDVGSGKTVVALLAMLRLAEHGRQSVLMAPTEILAKQHFKFVERMCAELGISALLLTGSNRNAQSYALINEGKARVVVGTHALFQESVNFRDLALVVVDEQHRFGVGQRLVLAEKGSHAHILQMTATPIPRSLTMTAFGDMDVSLLREKPPGRTPINTSAIPQSRMQEVIEGLKRAFAKGERAYWICPLIEESADDFARSDLAAAKARFIEFQQIFGNRVGLMHGRLSPAQRDETMSRFADGTLQLLVATTVVEVGVDVPEATIIVIEQAERFGLAQLHQLRGRVGRGSKPSHCILLYKDNPGQIAQQRLKTIRDTEDGFRIAEEDLRLRGAGDILGTKQSGLPDFRFADLGTHADLMLTARDDVKMILENDPLLTTPRGEALRVLLYLFEYDENIQLLKAG
jgi:ATP-dependent DNA helicase RecG